MVVVYMNLVLYWSPRRIPKSPGAGPMCGWLVDFHGNGVDGQRTGIGLNFGYQCIEEGPDRPRRVVSIISWVGQFLRRNRES